MILQLTQQEFDSILHITNLTENTSTNIVLDNELFLELYEQIELECETKPELVNILTKMLVIDKDELIIKTTI